MIIMRRMNDIATSMFLGLLSRSPSEKVKLKISPDSDALVFTCRQRMASTAAGPRVMILPEKVIQAPFPPYQDHRQGPRRHHLNLFHLVTSIPDKLLTRPALARFRPRDNWFTPSNTTSDRSTPQSWLPATHSCITRPSHTSTIMSRQQVRAIEVLDPLQNMSSTHMPNALKLETPIPIHDAH